MRYSPYDDAIKKKVHEDYELIAGIDEVGRGPLAGPVVTCAVICLLYTSPSPRD